MSRSRVLFVGSDLNPLSVSVLDSLSSADDFEIAVLLTRPQSRGWVVTARHTVQRHGWATLCRGGLSLLGARVAFFQRSLGLRRSSFRSLLELTRARRLETLDADRINARATVATIRDWHPDVLLVAACDQILKLPLLEVPRLGCVNVHPSLLPAYRGPNPYYWVLRHGERRSGVTFHLMDAGIDTGDILVQETLPIADHETERSLQARSAALAGRLAPAVLRGLADGSLRPRPQETEGASYHSHPPRGASTL